MRYNFGLNTNLFETNVLNLIVVLGVVVTIVGDAIKSLLDQRRQTILSVLQEADKKAREAQKRLEEARAIVEVAHERAQEIRAQALEAMEQENYTIQKQLQIDLQRLQERGQKAIQLERQRTVRTLADQVANLALNTAERTLLLVFVQQGSSLVKQKELNEAHLRETFQKLEKCSL